MSYILKKEFRSLGLEAGDYFPVERFTKDSVQKLLSRGVIEKEI